MAAATKVTSPIVIKTFLINNLLVRVRRIELRSQVWKTCILTAVLHPLVTAYTFISFRRLRQKLRFNVTLLLFKNKADFVFGLAAEMQRNRGNYSTGIRVRGGQ
jgi:hypothetical protein